MAKIIHTDSDLLDISRVTVSTVLITPDNGTKGILVEEESCTGTMVQGQFRACLFNIMLSND